MRTWMVSKVSLLCFLLAGAAEAAPYAVEVTASSLNVRAQAMGTVLGQVHAGQGMGQAVADE